MRRISFLKQAFECFDLWAKHHIISSEYPGFSISIADENHLIFSKAYGHNKDNHLSQNHLFRMASISKNITSIAVMQLVEQNKLTLDDKICYNILIKI